jgi:cytochrome c-type biogenesis protein CcmH/NrfG
MATIINTPPSPPSEDSSAGIVIGIIFGVLIIVLLLVFGTHYFQNGNYSNSTAPAQTSQPAQGGSATVNVTTPAPVAPTPSGSTSY